MAPRKKDEAPVRQGNLTEVLGITLSNPPVPEEPEEATNKPDFFGDIQNYFTKRRPIGTNTDSKEIYIQARFVSMAGAGFDAAASYNKLASKLPKWARAAVLYWLTPAMDRAPRMEYIKAEKAKTTDAYNEVINKLVRHFHCRPKHAHQIYALLEAQKFDIYEFFGLKTPRGYAGGKGSGDDTAKDDSRGRKPAKPRAAAPGIPRQPPPAGSPFARRRVG